jgi:hypothetical protein
VALLGGAANDEVAMYFPWSELNQILKMRQLEMGQV